MAKAVDFDKQSRVKAFTCMEQMLDITVYAFSNTEITFILNENPHEVTYSLWIFGLSNRQIQEKIESYIRAIEYEHYGRQ